MDRGGWYLTDTTNRGNNVVNFIKGSKGLAGSSSLLAVTLLLLSLVGGNASAASTATIDKMTLKPFGGYMQTYTPGYGFGLFSTPYLYQVNDGNTWESGAGSFQAQKVNLLSVSSSGKNLVYTFARSADGQMLNYTDYNSGSHSSQGVLGQPERIILTAKRGSSVGRLRGFSRIISNVATYYESFNYYSAAEGQLVPVEVTITLNGAAFTPTLFDQTFNYYRLSGKSG